MCLYHNLNMVHAVRVQHVRANLDPATGLLASVTVDGVQTELRQNFLFYKPSDFRFRASGAYVFRPRQGEPAEPVSLAASITTYKGQHACLDIVTLIQHTILAYITSSLKYYAGCAGAEVEEVHQQFAPWLSQVVRLHRGDKHLELEWLVGPLPVE